jgi:dienelactone hydrolase
MPKSLFLPLFASALLLSVCPLAAGADSLPGVESFFKNADLQSALLSPHGRYVATVNVMADGRQVLGVRDTANLNKLTIAATTKSDRIESLQWVNENRLSFTQKNAEMEAQGAWREYAVDRDGKNFTELINGNRRYHQEFTGSLIKSRVLTGYYRFAATLQDGSDDIVVIKYVFRDADRSFLTSRLYRLNTRTRALSDLLEGPQPSNVRSWLLDFEGRPRLAVSEVNGRCSYSYRAPEMAGWHEIGSFDCYRRPFIPAFFDSNGALYARAFYHGTEALFSLDLKTMKLAAEPLVNVDGFDVHASVEQDGASKKILGMHIQSDAESTVWFDPHWKDLQKKIDALLPATVNTLRCGAYCQSAPAILVTARSDRQPPQYLVYSVASGVLQPLGQAYPAIRPAQMGLRDFYHYRARDGRQIPVYVTTPPGKLGSLLPTVVLVHGGPNQRGASWEWEREAQFLASRGYLVIEPEYRGSMGFGPAHFQAGWQQWGRAMQDDLADAAQWAAQKGWADPKRIAIMGGGYGGYATLMGLIRNPAIFRCGVEWAGVSDIETMFSVVESDFAPDSLQQYSLKTLIGDPLANAAQFRASSPLLNAAKLTQPLLMAYGRLDRRVPPASAANLRKAVSATNAQLEWIAYDDEAADWQNESNRIDFWRHVEAFLDKNLKTIN